MSLWYLDANISFLRHYNTALDVSYVTIVSFESNTTFVARSLDTRRPEAYFTGPSHPLHEHPLACSLALTPCSPSLATCLYCQSFLPNSYPRLSSLAIAFYRLLRRLCASITRELQLAAQGFFASTFKLSERQSLRSTVSPVESRNWHRIECVQFVQVASGNMKRSKLARTRDPTPSPEPFCIYQRMVLTRIRYVESRCAFLLTKLERKAL